MILPPAHRAFALRLPASAPLPDDESAAELAGLERGELGYEPDHRRTCRPRRRTASSQSMEATVWPPLPRRSDVVVLDENDDHGEPA